MREDLNPFWIKEQKREQITGGFSVAFLIIQVLIPMSGSRLFVDEEQLDEHFNP